MDRIYRYQRSIYDATRRFFLLGRDDLLDLMTIAPGEAVLEVGCGTGRNLRKLADRQPGARLCGLDASAYMLEEACRSAAAGGQDGRILFRQGLAEALDPAGMFDVPEGFDHIFFSYSLSMMPTWQDALAAASAHCRATGRIYLVDFWDQANWPAPVRWLLVRWLALFHVRHDPALLDHLQQGDAASGRRLSLLPVCGRYAFLAVLEARS